MRENRQMTNKKLYCDDVLQMLFADSDSEGEYLRFGNDDRPSNARASPGNCYVSAAQWCHWAWREFTKHKQVIISALYPMGMGVAGMDVILVSIGEALCC